MDCLLRLGDWELGRKEEEKRTTQGLGVRRGGGWSWASRAVLQGCVRLPGRGREGEMGGAGFWGEYGKIYC